MAERHAMAGKLAIVVHYTVLISPEQMTQLQRVGKEHGYDGDDAGPILIAQRALLNEGINGALPDDHQLGLEFTHHRGTK